jgi:CheY-like chemotaxis protein
MQEKYIVYVDDDEDDRMILEESFQSVSQYAFFTFEDGQSLLSFLENQERLPCLTILDINMPKMSGIDILKAIRESERYKALTVVMFSTSANPADKALCEQLNARIVTKPDRYEEAVLMGRELITHCKP